MVRGHRVYAIWPLASPMNVFLGHSSRLFVTDLALITFLALFVICWVWWRGSQLFAHFSFVPDSYRTLFFILVSC